ncbi:hypothetical protein AgCh_026386 [Apium graveolens]
MSSAFEPAIILWNPLVRKYNIKTLRPTRIPGDALTFGFVPEDNDYVVKLHPASHFLFAQLVPVLPLGISISSLGPTLVGESDLGGTQGMLDFCAKQKRTSEIELIDMNDIN